MSKKVNYTEEQTAYMIETYEAVKNEPYEKRMEIVKEIALELNRKPRSVVAKLSREAVYIPKEKVSKVTGEAPQTKEMLAEKLVEVSGLNLNTESVAKMNKLDISRLIEAFESSEEYSPRKIAPLFS